MTGLLRNSLTRYAHPPSLKHERMCAFNFNNRLRVFSSTILIRFVVTFILSIFKQYNKAATFLSVLYLLFHFRKKLEKNAGRRMFHCV